MTRFIQRSLAAAALLISVPALADVSVHVLDTNQGLPGQGVDVRFYQQLNGEWQLLSEQTTNAQGRINSFALGDGDHYRVVFDVAPFFDKQHIDSFYSEIPVEFNVTDKDAHYHIPLLLSPYAYSTYRGN
ncbi:hydroxyisourate hydrolase [Vibrio ostreae]|uniref:5-hydroxyisourate hydrolase n=2 Tax=Vibrio TaxID=662 RepID=A0A975U832_9VIBR|nr:hydroxyisourate hydrolase [Vibrio ostreae]QXO15599.1 hydroxyisourate hydrolase [Vibrio ostreae]WGY45873.1 hydroxyisourate hydrolase [Vibrio sp. ABG19]